MSQPQSPQPVRAAWFFSLILFLGGSLGGVLQGLLGLNGLVLTEFLLFLGVAVYFAGVVDRQPAPALFRIYRLRWSGLIKSVVLGLVAWALANIMGSLIIDLITRFGGQIPEVHTQLAKAPLPIALVAGALVPAICEEAAFRGYIQWNLRPFGPMAGPLLTGVLFGVMHLSLIRLLPLVTLGIIFAVAVQRSGSILCGMIMHFLNNAISLVLSALQKSPATPPLPNRMTVIALVVILICLAASAWGLLQTFSKDDSAAPRPTAEARLAAVPDISGTRLTVALLPALVLWVWSVTGEIMSVMHKG